MEAPSYDKLKKNLDKGYYKIFNEPYKLNIVGIRSASRTPNRFDDYLCAFYKNNQGKVEYGCWKATTDPGTYWLNKPSHPFGTAAIVRGQYPNSHQIGNHNGYTALVQKGNIDVYRDLNRDSIFDYGRAKVYKTDASNGINIHRAAKGALVNEVGQWSAGCQVFQSESDFLKFMEMAKKHRDIHGNNFTYTLLDERYDMANDVNKSVADLIRFK